MTCEELYNRAITSYEEKDYEAAIVGFTEAITIQPDFTDAYYYRALAYGEIGVAYGMNGHNNKMKEIYSLAIEDFTQTIKFNPKHIDAYFHRGLMCINIDNDEKAIEDLKKVVELNPQHKAYLFLCDVYYKKGYIDQAKETFAQIVKFIPKYAKAYSVRGSAYMNADKFEEAAYEFNKAIFFNPGDADAYCGRAIVYGKRGDNKQAIADCDEALRLNPEHPIVPGIRQTAIQNIYCQPAYEYYQNGEYDHALEYFSEAIRLDPNFAKAYIGRGSVYAILGKLKEAVIDLDMALEINPNDNDIKIIRQKVIEGKK